MSNDILSHIDAFIQAGFLPLPVERTGHYKACLIPNWTQLKLDSSNPKIQALFSKQDLNIGLALGEPSHGLVDVDLDCQEALVIAEWILPKTKMRSGRPSRPNSHFWYQVTSPPHKASLSFDDPFSESGRSSGKRLIELRSTGAQTVIWGIHQSGETISYTSLDPAMIEINELVSAVRDLAAICLLARYWPSKGSRNDAFLALCGGLLGAGWSEDRITRFVQALCQITQDEETRNRLRQISQTSRKQVLQTPTTGWPTLIKLLGPQGNEIVSTLHDWLELSKPSKKSPCSLHLESTPQVDVEWPHPPAVESYYGLAGEIVRALEPTTEADPIALLAQFLIRFGNCVGQGPHFIIESTRHYTNEFIILVGSTSNGRKGTSNDRIEALFEIADEVWSKNCTSSGLSSGEGLIWAVRDPVETSERVSQDKGEAPKYEMVVSDPGISDKRLCVYEPEFANVLKVGERQGNTLSPVIRQAWDAKTNIKSMTKNSPTGTTNAHISIIGHITPTELQRCLTTTEAANGYANRHLFICVRRSKFLPEGGELDPSVLKDLQQRIADALTFARNVQRMHRDDQAKELWSQVYPILTRERFGLAAELSARAAPHVVRLSMLYALLDHSCVIRLEHLQAALAFWDYCERSILFLFGESTGNPLADEILHVLKSCPEGMRKSEIHDLFHRNYSAKRMDKALNVLRYAGLASSEQINTGERGRPAELWKATKLNQGDNHE